MKRSLSYRYLRFPVAAILIFAALAKTHQTTTEPSSGIPWLAMGHVLFEMGLGLSLFFGLHPRLCKWMTIAVFSVFFCVAIDLALKSASSCGCFGKVHVDPRITACLDAAVVFALLFSTTDGSSPKSSRKQVLCFVGTMLLSLPLFLPMLLHPPVEMVDHGKKEPASMEEETEKAIATIEPVSGLVPKQFDLGYVESKSIHRFTLEIVNDSERNWSVGDVKPECECITVVETPSAVAPVAKTPVILKFTAPDIDGPYTKTIKTTIDDRVWESRLHARINHPLRPESDQLVFSVADGRKELTLVVINDGPVPIRLLYATSIPPICSAKIGPEPVPPGGRFTLPVTLRDPTIGQSAVLTIHANHKHQKMLRIPIRIAE